MTIFKPSLAVVSLSLLISAPASAQHHRGGQGSGNSGATSRAVPRPAPSAAGAWRPSAAVPRIYGSPRIVTGTSRPYWGAQSRVYAGSPRGVGVPRAVPRVYAPRVVGPRAIAPVRFYRPYYAFRPRVSLGFGLWVGFPIAYPAY